MCLQGVVCVYVWECVEGGALGQNEVAASIMRAEVWVCVHVCASIGLAAAHWAKEAILFSARAEAPVATDAVLHSNKSSLITVSNVCICVFK